MVVNFEVGKTYRYKGKIGDPSPFTDIGISKRDARLMVSGAPLVCTYVEEGLWCPAVGFRGMRRENEGWSFTYLYYLFDEVKETTVAEEKQEEEKKEMTKFEVGKKYRYTGLLGDALDFTRIGIDVEDAVHIASGKPLTVEWFEHSRRIKFKELKNPWAFTYAMLDKFEEVADDAPVYGERVEPSEASYIARQTEWVTRNNVKVGTKVRVTRTAKDHEGGWNNAWVSGMDKNVGRTGTFSREIEPSCGLYIDFGTGEDRAKYCYPFFVLEVVNDTLASNDTYVPIKEFEEGKWYVCHATERPDGWNPRGEMDALLDGKPHKCILGKGHLAEFEGIPQEGVGGWNFWGDLDYFEEVPAPTAEVDWEEKYTALKDKVIAMLSILGDTSEDFKEEIESL